MVCTVVGGWRLYGAAGDRGFAFQVAISAGKYTLTIKFMGITLLTQSGNICDGSTLQLQHAVLYILPGSLNLCIVRDAEYFSLPCPVAVGSFTGQGTIAIPSAAPAGSYTIEIEGTSSTGTQLFCENISVSIGSSAKAVDHKLLAVHDLLVEEVNAHGKWKAKLSPRFAGRSLAYAKDLCGTRVGMLTKLPVSPTVPAGSLPTSFDARTAPQWSACKDRLSHVRDQADCGSCWAFGSTEAFNDRLCISTGGKYQAELSAQDTTSCCNLFTGCGFSQGCQGGDPTAAWSYFVNTGVVTGGDYDTIGSGSTCFPYQLANCAHHEASPKYANCSSSIAATPACPNPKACSEKKYSTPWANDKQKAKSAYSISGVEQIQTEIMTYGPVTAAFTVYQDFLTYHSGVYEHLAGPQLGGHAVKIIGWGEENGVAYWTVANSWNQYWGMNGFFKIKRGVDECGIEDDVSAGHT